MTGSLFDSHIRGKCNSRFAFKGAAPVAQLEIAKALRARGRNSTPLATIVEATGFDLAKVKRTLRAMWVRDRVQGIQIEAVELTAEGREWLRKELDDA